MKAVGETLDTVGNTLGERDGDGFTTLGLNCVNVDDPR